MKAAVIVVWRPKNYPHWHGRAGNEAIPNALAFDTSAAPYTAIHLASLFPKHWQVSIVHEMVRDVDLDMDVDVVFLSTLNYCAPHARYLARQFRSRGVRVIVGGLFPTLNPEYFSGIADAIVVGEAEPVMPAIVADAERNQLQPLYRSPGPADLSDLPIPRYDLVETDFKATMSYEATRGCPYACSFCVLSAIQLPYRRRPIPNVIRDLRAVPSSWNWLQRRFVMFWDNNLGVDRVYFRELCDALVPLKRVWGTETSIDTITAESARMMSRAGCRSLYIGLESLSPDSLRGSNKLHNKVSDYRKRLRYLHDNGIIVMSIFLVGLDGDTPEYIRNLPDLVHDIGVDVPVFSFAAPIEGTPFHQELRDSGRLLTGDINAGLDGMHLVYKPQNMSPEEVELALFECMRRANHPRRIAQRILRRTGRDIWTTTAVTMTNLIFRSYQRSLHRAGRERVLKRGAWPDLSFRGLHESAVPSESVGR